MKYQVIARVIGPMPPFDEVAYAIWGKDINFDSDGDSDTAGSHGWRELTVSLRPGNIERLDIDPTDRDRNVIQLIATHEHVLRNAVDFLCRCGSICPVR